MGVPYQGVDMTKHLQYVTVRNEVGAAGPAGPVSDAAA